MRGCHVMAKPASARCNLHCRYCFYLGKNQQARMDDVTLEAFIQQHIAAQPGDVVEFSWQGGEPLLAGLPFYQKVVALQRRYAAGKQIQNSIQTNGTLLNEEWCHFLHANKWLVGISIDGPIDLHDCYRVTRGGKPTHHRVVAAIERLRAFGIEFNLLVVVSKQNCAQPERLYHYLTTLGTPFLQFIPLVEKDEQGEITPESVSEEGFGAFLNAIFDLWVRKDIGNVFVQIFDSTLGVWCGHSSQMCSFSTTCGHAFALESNGDLYQCDHYVYPEHKLGNIHSIPITTLNHSQKAVRFGEDKQRRLVMECQMCPVLRFCQGDCPKHRIRQGKSYLCKSYYAFFTHTSPYMKMMRDLIKRRRSPIELMSRFR